ncbi:hypothetical protein [Pseudomonas sp. NPDC086251]|uniref:hypothetical protein n=1 Tax=Pseudomonas sp. NPDC086251 TaxID=3364431 RepID=UPI00383908E0
MANNETIAEREEAMVSMAEAATEKLHQVIHGDDLTDVTMESGLVPTLAKQARLFAEAIPDAVSELSAQMADGRVHATVEAGLSVAANGQSFYVENTDPLVSRSLYVRVDAANARHVSDDPNLEAFKALIAASAGFPEMFDAPNQWPDHDYTLSAAAANVPTPDGRFAKLANTTLTKGITSAGRPQLIVGNTDGQEGAFTWNQTLTLLGLSVGDAFSVAVRAFSRIGAQQARVLVRQMDGAGAEITAVRQSYVFPGTLTTEVVAKFGGIVVAAGTASISVLVGVAGAGGRLAVGDLLIAKGSLAEYRPNVYKPLNAAIAAAVSGFQTQISSNTQNLNLLNDRVEGITEVFDNPNLFTDKDFTKSVAAAGLDTGGSGSYSKSASAVLNQITTNDGRKGFAFTTTVASTQNFRWMQTLALLGLVAGDKFSASLRVLGGTAAGLTRVLIRQFDASSAEITASRQQFIFTNGVLAESVIKFSGVTVAALAVSIDIYIDTNNTSAVLQLTDYMLAKGSVAEYRPATKGRLATSEDLSSIASIDANREKWRWTPNVFPDPRFSNSGTSYSWATGAATPIVVKNGQGCIETPSSVTATNRRTAKISVANFKSGKLSASLVMQEKVGDQGANGLQLRLVAYNAAGAQLTWTSVGSDGTDTGYYTRYLPQADVTAATTLLIADNVSLPAGTTDIAFDIRIQTTVQAYLSMVCLREGADSSFKDALAIGSTTKPAIVTPAGSDVTGNVAGGLAFASLGAAITALGGNGIVLVRGAEFGKGLQFSPALVTGQVVIIGEWTGTANPIVRMSDKLTGISKTAGQIKVYQVTTAAVSATPNWIYQDGVADARTLIEAGRHQPEHNGRANRLPFTKIVKATATTLAAALTELDVASDPRCFYDAGVLYFTVDSGADATTANIYIDAPTGLIAAGTLEANGQLTLQNLEVRYGGINTRPFKRTHLDGVVIHGSRNNCWDYAGSSTLNLIEASCAGSTTTDGTGDGVSGHNHAHLSGMGLYAHDCMDDGESCHEWGRVRLRDFYCEYNGGTAVAPAYGCDAIYTNGRSFRNQRITGRKPSAFCVVGAPQDGGDRTLAIFRSCRSEEDIVSFSDSSTGTASYALCEDCESINPTTVGYDVYKIRNSRHSGTGAPKTAKVIVENTTLVT